MISRIKAALRRILGPEPVQATALTVAKSDGWWAAFKAIEREYADHKMGLPSRVEHVRRTCSPLDRVHNGR